MRVRQILWCCRSVEFLLNNRCFPLRYRFWRRYSVSRWQNTSWLWLSCGLLFCHLIIPGVEILLLKGMKLVYCFEKPKDWKQRGERCSRRTLKFCKGCDLPLWLASSVEMRNGRRTVDPLHLGTLLSTLPPLFFLCRSTTAVTESLLKIRLYIIYIFICEPRVREYNSYRFLCTSFPPLNIHIHIHIIYLFDRRTILTYAQSSSPK